MIYRQGLKIFPQNRFFHVHWKLFYDITARRVAIIFGTVREIDSLCMQYFYDILVVYLIPK